MLEENADICKLCNAVPIDRTVNPESEICSACREKCIRHPFPKWMKYAVAAVIAACIISFIIGDGFSGYIAVKQADREFKNRNYLTAQHKYELADKNVRLTEKEASNYLTALVRNAYLNEAVDVINKYFMKRSIESQAVYDTVNGYVQYLTKLIDTTEKVQNMFKDEQDDQEILKKISGINDPSLDQSYLKFYTALIYMKTGNYENALPLLQDAYKGSPKSSFIAEYEGLALRRTGKYSEARDWCNYMLAVNNECVWALRQLAAIDLLDNDYSGALESASKAYTLDSEYAYVADTLAIAYHFNGRTDERDKLLGKTTAAGSPMTDEMRSLLEGKITLEQYYSN